jgi:hypothetical protein
VTLLVDGKPVCGYTTLDAGDPGYKVVAEHKPDNRTTGPGTVVWEQPPPPREAFLPLRASEIVTYWKADLEPVWFQSETSKQAPGPFEMGGEHTIQIEYRNQLVGRQFGLSAWTGSVKSNVLTVKSSAAGGVWITLLPRSPIRSMAEYHQALLTTDVQTPERTMSVPFPARDLEIRRAVDQQRVARVTLAESKFLPYNLTEQQTRGIGPLPDGDYLVAFSRNGRRCSNVARLKLDSRYDPNKEPTLSLVPLPLEAWQDLPLLGIRAVGPTPIDPLLTNDKVPFPKLVVDGEQRDLTAIKWVGPVGPVQPGQQEVRILDLGHYQPAIDLGRTHTVKALVGKYESGEVRIPADDVLGRQWDAATKKLSPRLE